MDDHELTLIFDVLLNHRCDTKELYHQVYQRYQISRYQLWQQWVQYLVRTQVTPKNLDPFFKQEMVFDGGNTVATIWQVDKMVIFKDKSNDYWMPEEDGVQPSIVYEEETFYLVRVVYPTDQPILWLAVVVTKKSDDGVLVHRILWNVVELFSRHELEGPLDPMVLVADTIKKTVLSQ